MPVKVGMDVEVQDEKIWCMGVADLDGRTASTQWKPMVNQVMTEGTIPVFQNAKYDISHIEDEGGLHFTDWRDTILEAHMLGHKPLNLPSMSETFLGVPLDKTFVKESRQKGKKKVRFENRYMETLEGCSLDAWSTRALHQEFEPQIQKWAGLYEKERRVSRVIMDMERTGLPMSQTKLKMARRDILRRMGALEVILRRHGIDEPGNRELVGQKFWRNKQVVLTTKKGALSTKGDDLKKHMLPEEKEWVEAFIQWHQCAKFISTYINNWAGKDFLHHSLNQTGTLTWRFSCSNPNLQNVTKSKLIPLYQLFVAPEGWTFISGDYAQLELRVLANAAGDQPLIDLFLAGGDPHNDTVARLDLLTRFLQDADKARRYAKTLNFGIPYGMGGYTYAKRVDMEKEVIGRDGHPRTIYDADAGQAFIDSWYAEHPAVKAWQLEQVAFAKEHGYVETFYGRPLWVAGIAAERGTLAEHAERQCYNFPIQGGAAEVVKDAMLECPLYLVNQVHDELLYLVPEKEAEEYRQHLTEALAKLGVSYGHQVPYTIEFEIGKTWGDIKHLEDIWLDPDDEEDEDE